MAYIRLTYLTSHTIIIAILQILVAKSGSFTHIIDMMIMFLVSYSATLAHFSIILIILDVSLNL